MASLEDLLEALIMMPLVHCIALLPHKLQGPIVMHSPSPTIHLSTTSSLSNTPTILLPLNTPQSPREIDDTAMTYALYSFVSHYTIELIGGIWFRSAPSL